MRVRSDDPPPAAPATGPVTLVARILTGILTGILPAVALGLGLCAGGALAQPAPVGGAPRKVVGLVFDDSGSMKGRINLPAFAAQILASSLDPARDTLFTLKLSTVDEQARRSPPVPAVPRNEFAAGRPLDEVVAGIRDSFSLDPTGDTPYDAVEVMLEALAREATRPDDEAFLVVLTDGKFDRLPRGGIRPDRYERYRRRLKSLTTRFVLIAPDNQEGMELQRIVEAQKVRSSLLEAFNAPFDRPAPVVSNSAALMAAMVEAVARINATDSASGRGGIIRIEPQRVAIDSPLTVSRLVGITFARKDGQTAGVERTSFGASPTVTVESTMKAADTADGWRDDQNKARTVQFNLAQALPPGRHTLDFDRPIGPTALFLFDTLAQLDLAVLDEAGRPLPLGRDGVPEAAVGQPLVVAGRLLDRIGGRETVVDPATVAGGSMAAWLAGPGTRQDLPLQSEPGQSRAVHRLRAGTAGEYEAGGTFSAAGFVRKEARRLRFRVVDNVAAPSVALTATECPGCAPDRLATILVPGEPVRPVAEVEVRIGPRPGIPFTAAIDGAPAWLRLVDPAGTIVAPDRALTAGPDGRLAFRLERVLDRPEDPVDHERPVTVRIRAAAPFVGEAHARAVLAIRVPQAHLRYVGTTRQDSKVQDPKLQDPKLQASRDQAPIPAPPLSLTGEDLAAGRDGVVFEISGLAGAPVRPHDFQLAGLGRPLSLTLDVSGSRITVRPGSTWCPCLLSAWWHVWGPDRIEVGYHGFGTARAAAPIAFVPSWAELGASCARLAAMVALALWAVIAAIQFARAPRFSKLSVASIRRRGQPIEAREPLRRWDARGNWRTVWGALLCRRLPARTEVEGLLLEATQGGPRLLLVGTSETIKIESDGRTVRTIREESPRLHFISLSWNSTFSDRRLFEMLTLKRS